MKRKALFICIHNSARSQMAEAFLKKYGAESFMTESAGLEPGVLNPNVVAVMKEIGIDISKNKTQGVFDIYQRGEQYDVVVTVCDEASAERCPVFPGKVKRLAWSLPDPSAFTGTQEEKLAQTRKVRDRVEEKVKTFIEDAKQINFWM